MKVFETQLPGVGTRYRVTLGGDGTLTIVVHNDGRREVFWRDDPDGDSEPLFSTSEENARNLAEIFDGTYFEPIGEDIEEALSDARIRWVAIPDGSPVSGRTIGAVGIRSKTGITVLAVERGDRTIANPTPTTELLADDILVVVGTDEAHEALETLLAP